MVTVAAAMVVVVAADMVDVEVVAWAAAMVTVASAMVAVEVAAMVVVEVAWQCLGETVAAAMVMVAAAMVMAAAAMVVVAAVVATVVVVVAAVVVLAAAMVVVVVTGARTNWGSCTEQSETHDHSWSRRCGTQPMLAGVSTSDVSAFDVLTLVSERPGHFFWIIGMQNVLRSQGRHSYVRLPAEVS